MVDLCLRRRGTINEITGDALLVTLGAPNEMEYQKRSKFGVVGSAVNMTARIESYSVGGHVLASQSIVDELGELLRIDNRRQFTPKGFSDALTIYEIGGIPLEILTYFEGIAT